MTADLPKLDNDDDRGSAEIFQTEQRCQQQPMTVPQDVL